MSDKNPSHMRTTVVVTATRRDTELVTSPIAAGSVSRSEIDARGSQTLDQTLNLTEGLYVGSKEAADTIISFWRTSYE